MVSAPRSGWSGTRTFRWRASLRCRFMRCVVLIVINLWWWLAIRELECSLRTRMLCFVAIMHSNAAEELERNSERAQRTQSSRTVHCHEFIYLHSHLSEAKTQSFCSSKQKCCKRIAMFRQRPSMSAATTQTHTIEIPQLQLFTLLNSPNALSV